MKRGRCANYDGFETGGPCPAYTDKTVFDLPDAADFVCPECGEELIPAPPQRRIPWGWIAAAVAGLAVIALGVTTLPALIRSTQDIQGGDSTTVVPPKPPPVPTAGWALPDPSVGAPCRLLGARCPDSPSGEMPPPGLADSLAQVLPEGARLDPTSVRWTPLPDGTWSAQAVGIGTTAAIVVPVVDLVVSRGPSVLRGEAGRLRVHDRPALGPGRTIDRDALREDQQPVRTTVTWSGRASLDGDTWRILPDGRPRPEPTAAPGPAGRDSLRLGSRAEADSLVAEREAAIDRFVARSRSVQADIDRYRRRVLAAVPTTPGRSGGCPQQEMSRYVAEISRRAAICPTLVGAELTQCERAVASQNALLRECQQRRGSAARRDPAAVSSAQRDANAYADRQWTQFARSLSDS